MSNSELQQELLAHLQATGLVLNKDYFFLDEGRTGGWRNGNLKGFSEPICNRIESELERVLTDKTVFRIGSHIHIKTK